MNIERSTCTITFGDQAENHAGMQQIGQLVKEGQGFHYDDLSEIILKWKTMGASCELYDLKKFAKVNIDKNDAYVLIIRNALSVAEMNPDELFDEQSSLDHDKKAFMYGRVVEKKARWNVCFGESSQEPDYADKKGRIVAWSEVPLLNKFMKSMPELFGPKAEGLCGEGNYYYDVKKCGIGFHGDGERRKVIALRLGASIPIHYQWYIQSKPIGERVVIPLNHGDLYVMSEKAVGTDWKKKNSYTLRHATGCNTFTK